MPGKKKHPLRNQITFETVTGSDKAQPVKLQKFIVHWRAAKHGPVVARPSLPCLLSPWPRKCALCSPWIWSWTSFREKAGWGCWSWRLLCWKCHVLLTVYFQGLGKAWAAWPNDLLTRQHLHSQHCRAEDSQGVEYFISTWWTRFCMNCTQRINPNYSVFGSQLCLEICSARYFISQLLSSIFPKARHWFFLSSVLCLTCSDCCGLLQCFTWIWAKCCPKFSFSLKKKKKHNEIPVITGSHFCHLGELGFFAFCWCSSLFFIWNGGDTVTVDVRRKLWLIQNTKRNHEKNHRECGHELKKQIKPVLKSLRPFWPKWKKISEKSEDKHEPSKFFSLVLDLYNRLTTDGFLQRVGIGFIWNLWVFRLTVRAQLPWAFYIYLFFTFSQSWMGAWRAHKGLLSKSPKCLQTFTILPGPINIFLNPSLQGHKKLV